MKTQETQKVKSAVEALVDLSKNKKEFCTLGSGNAQQASAMKKLWREGNNSKLIKIGMALVVFPEPTPISETIGACFIAAGAVQKGIQKRSIFMEDIAKTFQKTFKEFSNLKQEMRI